MTKEKEFKLIERNDEIIDENLEVNNKFFCE